MTALAPAAAAKPGGAAAAPYTVNRLYYDFWFEPQAQPGMQFKMRIYRECTYGSGGGIEYAHDYFTNPFMSVQNAAAERISTSGKRTPVTDVEKINYKSPGILYSESDHFHYRFPELNAGDRTVSVVVYNFRESRCMMPVFFGQNAPIQDFRVHFSIPPGIGARPYFFHCDSADFRIVRTAGKKNGAIDIIASGIRPMDTKKNDDIHSSYYAPFIYFFIRGGQADGMTVHSLDNLRDLYAYHYTHLALIPPADTAKLREIAGRLTSAGRRPQENLESLFNWVKENIKYTAIMEGKKTVVPESATDVVNSRYGDCKGMTSLLNGLAAAAGIPLHYGWVGTRDISYQPSEIPVPFAFDHMVGVYMDEKDTVVLDATNKSAYMGEVSSRLYGKEILVDAGPANYVVYKVPTPAPAKNRLKANVRYSPVEDGWSASYTADLEGQRKLLFNYLNRMPASSFERNKKPNPVFPELETAGAVVFEVKENEKQQAGMRWQQPLGKGAVKTSDSWLLNPFPEKYKPLLGMDTENRQMPMEVDYPFYDELTISVQVPEGYILQSQPPEVAYSGPLGEIRCHTRQEKDLVISEFSLVLKPLLVYPSDFPQFITFKDTLKKCVSEYLVFKKRP